MVRIREPDKNRTQTKYRRTGTSVTYSNCGQYRHNRRLCPNPIVAASEGTQGSDAATRTGGVDAATANEPGAAVEANGSAAAPTARSRMSRGRGRERAAVGMGRGRDRGRATSMTAPASKPSNTPAPPSQPPHTPVLPSQPATLPTPASLPTTLSTPASLPTTPASQPLPKTKIFGVRRSGRLKIGVRKTTNQPPEHVDLTLD
ncbi:polycomb protein sop-2-like [Arachis ipaensis]|uniref:polycomb protein sop-2-like n=1 Tax=Arachis ipaensis TaxID=130454 RepID=UPI000A2B17EB|nr:polycomb protein sop-2-like [Arachis ipaensis]